METRLGPSDNHSRFRELIQERQFQALCLQEAEVILLRVEEVQSGEVPVRLVDNKAS